MPYYEGLGQCRLTCGCFVSSFLCISIFPIRTALQHSLNAVSIDSPALMILTPHIPPCGTSPLYVAPIGVFTVTGLNGR